VWFADGDVLQSSTGAASTLERMSKETDASIAQVHADVAAKKSQVGVGEVVAQV